MDGVVAGVMLAFVLGGMACGSTSHESTLRPDASLTDAQLLDAGATNESALDVSFWQNAVIYMVITDRFANGSTANDVPGDCFGPESPLLFHGGDFAGLTARLPYLQSLGVNAVWITPIQKQGGRNVDQCGYHGYWADLTTPDDVAIEPYAGDEHSFQVLLDEMHARGMRLILDFVVNHTGRDARLPREHPDWFHDSAMCNSLGNATVNCPLNGLPDLAQEKPEVAAYLDEHTRAWLHRFPIDGIRMDTVKHVPLQYFREHWIPTALSERPGLFLLGELFDGSGYTDQVRTLNAGFHSLFDFPLHYALVDALAKPEASLNRVADRVGDAIHTLGMERALLRVNFIDNHDMSRFGTEAAELSASVRAERYLVALSVLFTVPGIPQLLYGDELGMVGAWPENRRDMPTWAFESVEPGSREGYLGDPSATLRLTRKLAQVRHDLPALQRGGYIEMWRPGGLDLQFYAFFRGFGASRAIVLVHAGDEPLVGHHLAIQRNPDLAAGDKSALGDGVSLTDALGFYPGVEGRIEDGELVASMPPRSVAIFTLP